jgi:hypothetical protein
MPDMAGLSQEFEENSEAAELLNASYLALARERHDTARVMGTEQGTAILLALSKFLSGLVKVIKSGTSADDGSAWADLPEAFLASIERFRRNAPRDFDQDLSELLRSLDSKSKLTERSEIILDNLCDLADTASGSAFKRMWRHH